MNQRIIYNLTFYLKNFAIVVILQLILNGISLAADSKLLVEKAMQNDLNEVELLLKSGDDVNSKGEDENTGLHWAASFGLNEMAGLLISNGANPNITNKDGNTPLHWAAGEGNTEIVKLLIAHGADINAKGKSNWTPLRWAKARKRHDIVNILESAGAKQ